MTIEALRLSRLQPLRRIAGAIALVMCGWLAVIVALTFGSAPGKSMAIVGSPAEALAVIARANGRVLAANNYVTFARSDDSDFVARLYAAGALLVLDAEQAGGCSGLPPVSASSLRAIGSAQGAARRQAPRSNPA